MNEEEMKLFKLIKKPLNEMVFFIVCLICIVPPTINHFLILFRDIDIDILVVQYLSIAIIVSYIFTSIVYILRKWKIIKYIAYTFVITLLFVFFFLKLTFGTNISPLLIVMLAETDLHIYLFFKF